VLVRRLSLDGMPNYLVETFLPRGTAGGPAESERRARSAAEALTQKGRSVRFDRAIHVPEDEICFFVFDAPSSRDAALAAQLAKLGPLRVVEAVSSVNSDREEEK
jgi:hypothetical protein